MASGLCAKLIDLNTNNSISSLFYTIIKEEIIIIQYFEGNLIEHISFKMNEINNLYTSMSDDEHINIEGFNYTVNFNIFNINDEIEILDVKKNQAIELLNIITSKCIEQKTKRKQKENYKE